jgi:hypothetical protein
MNNNALIVLWKGNSIPDYLVGKIAEILTLNNVCTPEMLTIKYKDCDGIANALIRDAESSANVSTKKDDDTIAEAIKQSVIYIGKRFERSLVIADAPLNNTSVFAIELSNAVSKERRNISFTGVGSNNELLTAVEILSTEKGIIPRSLAKKYHFTKNVVEVIKTVYNTVY